MSKCDLTKCLNMCANEFYQNDIGAYEKCTGECQSECMAFGWANTLGSNTKSYDSSREDWGSLKISDGRKTVMVIGGIIALVVLIFLIYHFMRRS